MSESEIIQESQHSYFTTVPNIVFELGLKANELAVYLVILRTAGDVKGKCTKSTKRIAQEAGVSEKVYTQIKRKLTGKNSLLKKPLIRVLPRKHKTGDPDTDLIVVTDIWLENVTFFNDPKGKLQVTKKTTFSPAEVGSKTTPGVGSKTGGGVGSKTTPKEERFEEEHLKNGTGMLPPSDMRQSTAFFDPFTYRLRNGEKLDIRTARSFAKYKGKELEKLVANVAWYEKQIDDGKQPKTTHEKFLQWAIKTNMAKSETDAWQNSLNARFMQAEHNLKGMKVMKTVVQLDKKDGNRPDSVSLNLPTHTFDNILQNYLKLMQSKGD